MSLLEEMSACLMPLLKKIRYRTYMLIHKKNHLQGRGLLTYPASAVSLYSVVNIM